MTEVELREQIVLDADVLADPMWQGDRITNMINQAQRWLQLKLIKQGFKNWSKDATESLSNSSYKGYNTEILDALTDRLLDMPILDALPVTTSIKPAKEIELRNLYEVINNSVLTPTAEFPIFFMVEDRLHIYPRTSASDAYVTYTKIVTDMVFENDSTGSEIPLENQEIIIERVVMQIKSSQGNEQVKQAQLAEIDKELSTKYQLDQLKIEKSDKEATQ